MEKKVLYLYTRDSNYDDIITFLKMYKKVTFSKITNNTLVALADDDFSFSDFSKLSELLLEELLVNFVGLYLPDNFDLSVNDLETGFKKINTKVYDITSFIIEICLEKEVNLQKKLRSYYYNLVGIDNINTVLGFIENNFNASKTSKNLYLHRNTLNYRLEHFALKTEMDIKKFQTALAIYLLFKR